jgi:hypothetical protein
MDANLCAAPRRPQGAGMSDLETDVRLALARWETDRHLKLPDDAFRDLVSTMMKLFDDWSKANA